MSKKIEVNPWPSFTEEEASKVSSILLSNKVNYWTGQEGREFEKEFADFVGSEYAVAVSNGTTALDLALHSLNIGAGDEVIVTSRTFIASISSIVNAGATPKFADVDRDSQNISVSTIEPLITERTRCIVCVHLAGWPCDMDQILSLAEKHNIRVIEDCAQAHGATFKGRHVGTFGDVGAWSFCQDKIMSTGGEGGMVTTNSKRLWESMWSYKDHGKNYSSVYEKEHPPGFRWLHDSFGTNWRLTEMQSAIGRIQLSRLSDWRQLRRQNANMILDTCAKYSFIRIPRPPECVVHAYYKCYVFVEASMLKSNWNRDRIVNELASTGVPVAQGSCSEVYLEKAFDKTGLRPQSPLPVAQELGQTSLMFQVHPTITEGQLKQICESIDIVFGSIES